jgi:hypothetical protein
MRGKNTFFGIVVILTILTGTAWCDIAVPVSPGGGTGLSEQNCPTFSWSASDGALTYRVEVYEQVTSDIIDRDAMRVISTPVVAKEIPAPALSWTPSSGECLRRGVSYIWYVEGVDAKGEGQWSGGRGFQVEGGVLSVEQRDAVKDVVRELVNGERADGGSAASTASGTAGATIKPAASITPMALAVIYGLGDATNTLLGANAGLSLNLSSDRYDTFIGAEAGRYNTTGSYNTYVGQGAGFNKQTGSFNTFVGWAAGNMWSTGDSNSFFGYRAGFSTESNSNSFFGYDAGYSNNIGSSNSFFGSNAGHNNVAGSKNVFVGDGSGFRNKGSDNSFLGSQTGFYNIDGDSNVFIGYWAGYSETGSNKLYIDNCITGNTASTGGNCTQPLIKGDFAARTLQIDGSLTVVTVATPSDIRYKKGINPLESSLEKVLLLQGVTYEWDRDKVTGAGFTEGKQIGLIAQEVEKVLPELVHTDGKGYKTLSYDKLGPLLIEAVKEQQKEIATQKKEIAEKSFRIERLEKLLEILEQRLASLENSAKTIALK